MTTLLAYQWRRHRLVLGFLTIGLLLFELLITRIAPTAEQASQISEMLEFLPEPITDAMGLQGISMITTAGVISFGYVHPFTILLLGAWIVRVAAGGLAGEMGHGTMDLLATRPLTRGAIFGGVATAQLAGLAILVAAAWSGTALGLATRDLGGLRPSQFLETAVGQFLLLGAFAGLALLISALHRSGGGAIGITSGMMAVLFALDYLARAWEAIGFLRPLSPFAYYQPHMTFDDVTVKSVAVLGGIGVVSLVAAAAAFRRRDI